MTTFEIAPQVQGRHGDFFVRSPEVDGRSHMRCFVNTVRGELAWTHVRQLGARGELIFEFATTFTLDGAPMAERRGERLLDANDRRVDGSSRPPR